MLEWAGLANLVPEVDRIVTVALFGYVVWKCVELFLYPENFAASAIIMLHGVLFRIFARYVVLPILSVVLPKIGGNIVRAGAAYAVDKTKKLIAALTDLLQIWAPGSPAALGKAARSVSESRAVQGASGTLTFVTGYGYGFNPLFSLRNEYLADVFEFNDAPLHATLASLITAEMYRVCVGNSRYMDSVTTPVQSAVADVPFVSKMQQWIVDWGMNFHPFVKSVVQAWVIARFGRLFEAISIASSHIFGSDAATALIKEIPNVRTTDYGAITWQSIPGAPQNATGWQRYSDPERRTKNYDPMPAFGNIFTNFVQKFDASIAKNNMTLTEIYGNDQLARFTGETYNFNQTEIIQATVRSLIKKRSFIVDTATEGFDILFRNDVLNTTRIRDYLKESDLIFAQPDDTTITERNLRDWYVPVSEAFKNQYFPPAMALRRWVTSDKLGVNATQITDFNAMMTKTKEEYPSAVSAILQSIYWLAEAQEATPPAASLYNRLSIDTLSNSAAPFVYGAIVTSVTTAAYTAKPIFKLVSQTLSGLGVVFLVGVAFSSFMGHADMAQIAAPPRRKHTYDSPSSAAKKRAMSQKIPDAPSTVKDNVRAIAGKYDHNFWVYSAEYALHIPLMRARLTRLFANIQYPFYCMALAPAENMLLNDFFFPALLAAPPVDALLPAPLMSAQPFVHVGADDAHFLEVAANIAATRLSISDPSFADHYMDLLDVYLVYSFAAMSTEEYDTFRGSKKTE
jgi:hypothetical protein